MRHSLHALALLASLPLLGVAQGAQAGGTQDRPAQAPAPTPDRASALAAELAAACPPAPANDHAAFESCAARLRDLTLPLGGRIAWGGDQPDLPIRKRMLTALNSRVFQTLYLPLFAFTGHWSTAEDPLTHTPILWIEAYFRNALPAGDYPYPFWHSAAKWSAYETANQLGFYLDPAGAAFLVTRSATGQEDRRGAYAHVQPPAFTGWQWRDPDGTPQPRASLFAARYSQANPNLPALEDSYRRFALTIRQETCLDCHTPANKADSERLVLLQTPLHAAGAIDDVITAIRRGEMPQDEIGLRKQIPQAERDTLLRTALAFRTNLAKADRWERSNPH